jgi:hypothetical protein
MNGNNIFTQAKNINDVKSTILRLLPSGKKEGNEWVAFNTTRNDKHLGSFRINLLNGKWVDHATGDKGGDVISLCAYLKGLSQYEAANYLLGNSVCSKNWNFTTTPSKVSKPSKVDATQYINKLWNEALNTRNSIVESYLKNRGLLLQSIPQSIRYHPNLYHKRSDKCFPAMLSAVTKYGSDKVVALHRTYLKADGSSKADILPNKMMLGQVKSAAVMLTSTNSKLVIAEGIETALSVYMATGISTWACLSTSGLINIEVPPINITQEIIIAADADIAGINAANTLAARLVESGYLVKIATPTETGTDFNDLLKGGAL